MFYSRPETKRRHTVQFAESFPKVYEAILHYKATDYRDLPLLMQKTEADLMIGTVCKRLVDRRRDIPFVTIHDSILTTPEHAQTINFMIRDAFEAIGLSPSIKIEVLR